MTDRQKMPFWFVRQQNIDGVRRNTFIVKLASCHDMRHYDSRWMDCPYLGTSETDDDIVLVPDVDLTEQVWVFDSDDDAKNYRDALSKVKELWADLVIV